MKDFEKKITSKIVKVETNLESYRSEVSQFKTEIMKEIKAGNEDTKEIKEGFFIYISFLAFDFFRFCVVIRFFHPRHNGQ